MQKTIYRIRLNICQMYRQGTPLQNYKHYILLYKENLII